MACFCESPGEVLVLPVEGEFHGHEKSRSDVLYSARRVLGHYSEISSNVRVEEGAWRRLDAFKTHPAVIQVPPGEERRTAERLSASRSISAAIPNFRVEFESVQLNQGEIANILNAHQLQPGALVCGSSVRVAVLDTGIDPSVVANCNIQYDVSNPAKSVTPHDNDGHGSTVGAVIQQVAPSTVLHSVNIYPQATLGSLLVGIQVAMSAFDPHIINMSVGLGTARTRCKNCGFKFGQQLPDTLLQAFFHSLAHYSGGIHPLLVASAGNGSIHLKLPASCEPILAVGSYDLSANSRPGFARFSSVPSQRFILADGGDVHRALGSSRWGQKLFGTSFSAAVVSGAASRLACRYLSQGPCSSSAPLPTPQAFGSTLLQDLSVAAIPVKQHNPTTHGLGLVSI